MCLPLNNEGKDQGPAGNTAGKIHTEGSQKSPSRLGGSVQKSSVMLRHAHYMYFINYYTFIAF